jgi:hypothetical protein
MALVIESIDRLLVDNPAIPISKDTLRMRGFFRTGIGTGANGAGGAPELNTRAGIGGAA